MLKLVVVAFLLLGTLSFGDTPKTDKVTNKRTAEAIKTSTASITEQILGIMARPNLLVNFSLNLKKDAPVKLVNLEGQGDFPFRDDLTVPLTSNSKDTNFNPAAHVHFKNLILHFASIKDAGGNIKTAIEFFKPTDMKTSVPLLAEVSSKDPYLSFQLSNVTFLISGLSDTSGKIAVTGQCDVQQSMMDFSRLRNPKPPLTGKDIVPQWKSAACAFSGTYQRTDGDYNVDFTYNSLK